MKIDVNQSVCSCCSLKSFSVFLYLTRHITTIVIFRRVYSYVSMGLVCHFLQQAQAANSHKFQLLFASSAPWLHNASLLCCAIYQLLADMQTLEDIVAAHYLVVTLKHNICGLFSPSCPAPILIISIT
jgi:hypothetical protein